jgi:hypothetical protein
MLRTMLTLWAIVALVAIALTILGGCDTGTGIDGDFAQVRVFNESPDSINVDTEAGNDWLDPGDSIDAITEVGGLHRVSIVTASDSIAVFIDVASLDQRSFIRVR